MVWKRPLFILGLLLLIVELVALILMPEQPMIEQEGTPDQIDLSYVTYYVVAFSAAFVAFFALLIGGILFILRGDFARHIWTVVLLTLAFLLPIFWYYL